MNAGTPFAIASTPVSATEPPAKALRRSRNPIASVPNGTASGSGGSGAASPLTMRTAPMATIVSARLTNRYVGTAKMFPDSRRPRRFAIVISEIDTNAISIRTS